MLAVIDAMVALLLIAVVLVQQSKDGGFGGSPFGGAGDAVFGGQAANHLTKITVALASIFLILTLSLAIITGRRSNNEKGVVEVATPKPAQISAVPKPDTEKQVLKGDQKIIDKLDGVSQKTAAAKKDVAETTEKAVKSATKSLDNAKKTVRDTEMKKPVSDKKKP